MYVGYSWPKVLQCPGLKGHYVAVFLDHTYLVAVSEDGVAVWSSGHARVRLGQHTLTEQELEQYGKQVAACWSPDRAAVAVLTEQGYLLVYDLHETRHPALPALRSLSWGSHDGAVLHAVDVYIKHPVRCQRRDVPAMCVCCDSRAILVAYADGYWGSCSWSGKMHPDLYDISPEALGDWGSIEKQRPQQQLHLQLARHAAVDVHYCEASRLLSVVFADGSAALLSPAGAGPLHAQLVFRRWLCTAAARATVARIAAQAQLIALGTASGEVHLLQQHCASSSSAAAAADAGQSALAAPAGSQSAAALSPLGSCGQSPFDFGANGLDPRQLVRSLDLLDWGHNVRQTGGVASLAWAPDSTALAAGYDRQGLVVWTPSGCRLLCTLRQPAPETPASGRNSALSPRGPAAAGSALQPLLASAGSDPTAALSCLSNGAAAGGAPRPLQHPAIASVDGSVLCLAWGPDGYQLVLAGQAPHHAGGSSSSTSEWVSSPVAGHSSSSGSSSCSSVIYELSLARSLRHHHRVMHASAADGSSGPGVAQLGDELHVLQASDRLLLITEPLTSAGPSSFVAAGMGNSDASEAAGGSSSDLYVHHVLLPAAYLAANWPLQHVAISPCGSDIAAAGARGLAVYNRKQERWRLFGEVAQERRIFCVALSWLSGCVVVASCSSSSGAESPGALTPAAAAAAAAAVASAAASGLELTHGTGAGLTCQLLLFPRNHLDFSSVVASTTLQKVPLAMDCTDSHILIASAPLELLVLQLVGGSSGGTAGASSASEGIAAAASRPGTAPSGSAAGKGRLVAVRELSLFNVGRPVQDVALVSAAAADLAHKALRGQPRPGLLLGHSGAGGSKGTPRYAVLLRWGGMLSVLDLLRGAELMLADEVESFWLSDTLSVPAPPASSKAGSTCASTSHSRTSSVQGLSAHPAVAGSAQELFALDAAAAAVVAGADEGAGVSAGGAAGPGGSGMSESSSSVDPFAAGMDIAQDVPEVVEMPWWAYGPVGMQLWFPSIVLAAMQLQTLHSSGSNSALHSQVSLPAQLTPHAASTGAFVGGLGSRAGSGVPGILARSGSSWPPGQGLMGLPSGASSVAALAAAGAAAAGQPGGSVAAALHMKHAQSAPLLAQDGAAAAAAGGFQTIQYGTEIELEFDREVYPIGVSLADASIVGVTQRVMRPQQPSAAQGQSPRAPRSSLPSKHHPLPSQGSQTPTAGSASSSRSNLSLPYLLPVPESQPVLPALLRRLLHQGAVPAALALAKRHEGGPHFRRSLEWLLFTTLDMEGSKCKPGKAGASSGGGWQQQQQPPLHVLQAGLTPAGAAAGVLGRQGKGWLGHPDGQPHPVPVTPLLAAAVELVLSFQPCLDVVVSVSRKTDASLWPALFSAVGSPSAVLQLLLDTGALNSAACFLIVVDRLEGSRAAQGFAVQLIQMALKRGQSYLCAEILRFLIPPREGVLQWGPGSPLDASAAGGKQQDAGQLATMQKQSSTGAAAAAGGDGQAGWFSWLWGGSSSASQQQQQQQPPAAGAAAAVDPKLGGRSSHGELPALAGLEYGADACRIVAEKAWRLLYQGKLGQLVQLIHSMSFLTGGLASIMAAFEPQQAPKGLAHAVSSGAELQPDAGLAGSKPKQQQGAPGQAVAGGSPVSAAEEEEEEVTVEVLIGCVLAAVDELPVWESSEVEQDAMLVLELVKELQVRRWSLAMAVVLVDMALLGPFAAAQPELWQQFCEQLLAQPELYFLHQLVGALVMPMGQEEEGAGELQEQLLEGGLAQQS